jgi:hypothetical protein
MLVPPLSVLGRIVLIPTEFVSLIIEDTGVLGPPPGYAVTKGIPSIFRIFAIASEPLIIISSCEYIL